MPITKAKPAERIDDSPKVAKLVAQLADVTAKRLEAYDRLESIQNALERSQQSLSADAMDERARAILNGEPMPTAIVDTRELKLAQEQAQALTTAQVLVREQLATARQEAAPAVLKRVRPAYSAIAKEVAEILEELGEALSREQEMRREIDRVGLSSDVVCSKEINGLAHTLGVTKHNVGHRRHSAPETIRRAVNQL